MGTQELSRVPTIGLERQHHFTTLLDRCHEGAVSLQEITSSINEIEEDAEHL